MARARMVGAISGPAVIVPARDDVDFPSEVLEVPFSRLIAEKREIPQMIDGIIRTNLLIPILNQLFIHFGRRRVRTVAEADHVFVAKVGVSGEEDGHS